MTPERWIWNADEPREPSAAAVENQIDVTITSSQSWSVYRDLSWWEGVLWRTPLRGLVVRRLLKFRGKFKRSDPPEER